ncbi:hypothetical protein C0J52_19556 [Blattella germanica]|nr:hypothetical protein C0J52_19556 [Blattella germanica]
MNYNMCGHFFCRTCLKGNKSACPSCGIPSLASEITADHLITNLVTGLQKISDTIGFKSESSKNNEIIIEEELSEKQSETNIVPENSNKKEKRASTKHVKTDNLKDEETKKKPRNSRSKQKHEVEDIEKHLVTKEVRKSGTRNSMTKNINKRNSKGETQLHVACIKGKIDQVKNFLENGANPNTKDHAGWTPLNMTPDEILKILDELSEDEALDSGESEEEEEEEEAIAESDHNTNSDKTIFQMKMNPRTLILRIVLLLEAVNNGFIDIVELLLKYGAMVSVPGYENITPLHEAVSNGRLEIIKLLMKYGANTEARNRIGVSPRELAQTDEIKALLNSTPTVLKPIVEFKPANLDPENVGILSCQLDKEHQKQLSSLSQKLKLKVLRLGLCLELRTLVDPEPFEVEGTSRHPNSQSPRRGRINAEKQFPSIFNGCHIFLAGLSNIFTYENLKLTKGDMTTLIRSGDGIVLSREPDPEGIPSKECTVPYHAALDGPLAKCSHYIIYRTGKDEPKLKYNMTHTKSLSLQWLFDCMECFTLNNP